ncbi:MAG: hypothetical protein GC159_14905 [Phycisphaera sp.]|nr:hypothetical protein [Phycisphaera sp.]
MNESMLVEEWKRTRKQSLAMLPVAVVMLAALGVTVWLGGLYKSDTSFMPGMLVGIAWFWVVLEWMTIVRTGRQIRAAERGACADAV